MTAPDAPPAIAFLCAMPMEAAPLVRRLALRPAPAGGDRIHRGDLDGRPVVAAVTGIGTDLAAAATERVLDAVSPAHVVVVGIAGAVDGLTPIGTVVRPERVVDGATGAELRPDPLGATPPSGVLWTSDVLVTDDATLAELRDRGVVALDMETAAIGRVCERHGVPWSVVRAISDRATDGSVDEEVLGLSNPDGTPDARAVARYVAAHPAKVPTLARLARGSRRACAAAVRAALEDGAALSPPP